MTRIEFARITAQIVNRASVWSFENVLIAQTSGPDEKVRQDVLDAFSTQITDLLDDLKPASADNIASTFKDHPTGQCAGLDPRLINPRVRPTGDRK